MIFNIIQDVMHGEVVVLLINNSSMRIPSKRLNRVNIVIQNKKEWSLEIKINELSLLQNLAISLSNKANLSSVLAHIHVSLIRVNVYLGKNYLKWPIRLVWECKFIKGFLERCMHNARMWYPESELRYVLITLIWICSCL